MARQMVPLVPFDRGHRSINCKGELLVFVPLSDRVRWARLVSIALRCMLGMLDPRKTCSDDPVHLSLRQQWPIPEKRCACHPIGLARSLMAFARWVESSLRSEEPCEPINAVLISARRFSE